MKTTYEQVLKCNKDISTYAVYHSHIVMGRQRVKFPFWAPKFVQNTRKLQKTGYK